MYRELSRHCKHYFAAGILCSLLAAFLDMLTPKLVQYTIDSVLGSEALPLRLEDIVQRFGGVAYLRTHLWLIAAAVVVLAVLAALFRYLYRLFNIIGTERFIKALRDKLFSHILQLPASWHDQNHTGDVIQRCTSDVETIRNFMSEQLTSFFRVIVLIVLAVSFMIAIHPRLAFISAAFIPVVILYSLFFHKKIAGAFLHADEEEGKLSAIAQENLSGVRVVRAFGRERYERERFETQNAGYTRMWIRLMGWLSAFWCSNDFITGAQIGLITVVGAVFCVRGYISVGEYIAFASYNGMLSWPVRELGRVISDMSRVTISTKRIRYILDSPLEGEVLSAAEAQPGKGVSFSHVSFSYDGSSEVLHDVSFDIKPGETLGILGGTGSGKSTLMALLTRLYELPEGSGSIRIDGRDIRSIPLDELRRYVGLVLQEPYLFSRSLAENIAITQPGEPDMQQLKKAVAIADLSETIERFSEGYDTFVGERGVTLSGGQKQRTAIAQMIMKQPKLYVFDDSLSAVDMETDARIREALLQSTKDESLILISHRITTLMKADHILVLECGRVAEYGTHEQLLSRPGIYRRIYDIQTEGAA